MNPDKNTLDALRIDRDTAAGKPALVWVIPVVLICLVSGGFAAWWLTRPQTAAVRTLLLHQGSNDSGHRTVLNASGYVVARREATVSSKITGKVVELMVEEGMKVTEGQILARLDDSNTGANLRLAEAQWEFARSALDETNVRLAEAETELKRITSLANDKVASASELDRATAEVHSLKARLERQKFEITVADRQVALWKQQMDDLLICAPFTGIVTSKNAQPGEMISPISAGGGFTRTGICTIVDMKSLEIEIDVNESYINRVEAGQSVEATLDAYPEWKIPSKVIAIVPTADRQKATVKVRVGFEKLDPRVLPQMGVKVAFRSSETLPAMRQALVIPKSAVRRGSDGKDSVWIVHDGRATRRALTVESVRGEELTVAAGLTSGEKLILDPPETLSDGDRVEEAKR